MEIKYVRIEMIKNRPIEVDKNKIGCPKDAEIILRKLLEKQDRENLLLLTLDVKNVVTSISTVSIGSLNAAIVHPREIFKAAILANAASIILGHNHPSGDARPSMEDLEITKRINEAGKLLGIELLDHIIIGDGYTSLKEQGII